jgi:hypothetical protein
MLLVFKLTHYRGIPAGPALRGALTRAKVAGRIIGSRQHPATHCRNDKEKINDR